MATPSWEKRTNVYYQCSGCGETRREPDAVHECRLGIHQSDWPDTVEELARLLFVRLKPELLERVRDCISPDAEAAWRLRLPPGAKL